MAPLPGLPDKKFSGQVDTAGPAKRSPTKKSKVSAEPDQEELDYGDGPALDDYESDEASWQDVARKKMPSKSRIPMGSFDRETDPVVLARRKKQIDFGKFTPEYLEYTTKIPKHSRTSDHPGTPNMHRKYSRRAWDGLMRQWRLKLHVWQKSPAEVELELEQQHRRRAKSALNESFCSEASEATTTSTSTSSSMFSDRRIDFETAEEPEPDGDKTLVNHETSWYEEVEEEANELNASHITDEDEESVHVHV